MTENTSSPPARKRRATAAKADSKAPAPKRNARSRDKAGQGPQQGRSAAAPAPEAQSTPDTSQVEAERVAERVANAQAALPSVDEQMAALKAALEGLDDDGARAAADAVIDATRGVRRTLSVRKSGGTIGPRTPKGEGRYQAVHPDGGIEARSNYRASTARDIAMAKKRIRDGESRGERDERLAACTLVDTGAAS